MYQNMSFSALVLLGIVNPELINVDDTFVSTNNNNYQHPNHKPFINYYKKDNKNKSKQTMQRYYTRQGCNHGKTRTNVKL